MAFVTPLHRIPLSLFPSNSWACLHRDSASSGFLGVSRFRSNGENTGVVMISSNDLRPGTTIELNGNVHKVLESMHVKPGKGSAFVRTKLKNMRTRNTLDKTFRAGENLTDATLSRVELEHTYVDQGDFVFMNMESFEEERLDEAVLGKQSKFLKLGMKVDVLKHGNDILGIELPRTVSYKITRADPGAKGNTAQGSGSKPAILETGAEVMVPLFVNEGDLIRVNIEDGKYLSREKG